LQRKGYKCITVRNKFHEEIRKKSKETNLNIKENIEYLMCKRKSYLKRKVNFNHKGLLKIKNYL
jgi:hypothetical protein